MDDPAAADAAATRDWAAYYRWTQGRAPRPLFVRGMAALAAAETIPGRAVEIGFGDGTETRILLARGWHVTAIDPTPDSATALRDRLSVDALERIDIVTATAEAGPLPPFDLLYAGFALPFIDPAAFSAFWQRVRGAIRPGGWLVVNVFGDRDSWAGDPAMTFFDRAAAEALVNGYDLAAFDEEDEDGDAFSGPKHWHLFNIVARRPGAPSGA